MVYLDNAATSYPKPKIVQNTVSQSLIKYGANPGRSSYKMAVETSTVVYKTRTKIKGFFKAKSEEDVIFTKSCTEALNMVILSKLKAGDHVVISDLEHNAVVRAVHALKEKSVEYSIFKVSLEDDNETIDNLRKALKPKTKLVVCTAASNVFGVKLPIHRLTALCHIYDIEICVDAAQGAGHFDIDISKSDIDYLCLPAHKGMFGIMGTGILITNKLIKPLIYGGTGTSSFSYVQPTDKPDALESGTLNVAGIMSLSAGIDYINNKSIEKIETVEKTKINYLYNKLENIDNVILYINNPLNIAPVISLNIKDVESEVVGAYLSRKNIAVRCGIHCAPLAHLKLNTENGTVRISPSVFTTKEEIDYFIKVLENYKN
ncbi:MAG: aminotransferase class V-fold PLP-dependent enzyme [Clostridia bacterium]